MAETQQLSASQAQVAKLLQQLKAAAGPGQALYAGRVLTPQDTPESIMKRTPAGDLEEYASMHLGDLGVLGAGAVGAGITKQQLKAGLRPIEEDLAAMEGRAARQTAGRMGQRVSKAELQAGMRPAQQIAQYAEKDAIPLVEPHRMFPAWGNPATGEVRHAEQAIAAGWHGPNTPMKMVGKKLVPDPTWQRGHVDPLTRKFYPETHAAFQQ